MKIEQTEIEVNGVKYIQKDSVNTGKVEHSIDGLPLVMIRSDRSGVHFGYLKNKVVALDKWNVELLNSRRVWYWSGAASISQLALEGTTKPNDCKFAVELPSIEISGVIEIIPINENAAKNLKGVKVWKL